MENATAAGSSQSNISRLYIWKRQLKKPKFWFTDSAEAEKQTENNTSLTENVLFVIDNAMTQMQEQRIKNIAVYNRQQDITNTDLKTISSICFVLKNQ